VPKKIKNQNAKKAAKEIEKDLAKKIGMFDQLPESCSSCGDFFDKTSIQEVASWQVTVRGDTVRIYCPNCWGRATELVKAADELTEGEEHNEVS